MSDIEELAGRYLSGEIDAEGLKELERRLSSDGEARAAFLREANLTAALEALALGEAAMTERTQRGPVGQRAARRALPWLVSACAAAAVLLMLWPREPAVATVTGLDGSLLWTGDRGRVIRDLSVGDGLGGGTIEGMTPESWFELTFRDGTRAVIVGRSTLTFSDEGRKRLRLREGTLTADVSPQPAGRPMLVQTRAAEYEVLGTRFQLDADLAGSALSVSEGTVQATRRSDGRTVAVPADHRVVADASGDFEPSAVPRVVSRWRSDVPGGPSPGRGWMYGDWRPAANDLPAALGTVPYTLEDGRTIHTAAIGVGGPPVALDEGSALRLRARVESLEHVFFGMTLLRPGGEFAGRYQVAASVDLLKEEAVLRDGVLEMTLPAAWFTLDPSLEDIRGRLPETLEGLLVESVWAHTLFDPAGLAVEAVEITLPEPEADE